MSVDNLEHGLAEALCLSVCYKTYCIKTSTEIEVCISREASFDQYYTVVKKYKYLEKYRYFVLNSGLRNFHHHWLVIATCRITNYELLR